MYCTPITKPAISLKVIRKWRTRFPATRDLLNDPSLRLSAELTKIKPSIHCGMTVLYQQCCTSSNVWHGIRCGGLWESFLTESHDVRLRRAMFGAIYSLGDRLLPAAQRLIQLQLQLIFLELPR